MTSRQISCCHISTVHSPFDTRIFVKEARTLAKNGYRVHWVVPHSKNEIRDGVTIIGIRSYRRRLFRITLLPWVAFWAAWRTRSDVYHFHDPELIPVALLLRALGNRVIYDVHEDMPAQTRNKYYIPRPIRLPLSKCLKLLEQSAAKAFSGVITATPAIRRLFDLPDSRIACVQNYPLLEETAKSDPGDYLSRPPHIVFTGWVRRIRGVLEVIDALPLVAEKIPNVKLQILGSFSPTSLEEEARALAGWRYVEYTPWLTRKDMLARMEGIRLGVVTFHPNENHVNAQPNKLFEYMASSLPVVASDFPLWRGIVAEHRCGELVDPKEPGQIAEAFLKLLGDPHMAREAGRAGRRAIVERYNWEVEAEKLLTFYAAHTRDVASRVG